MSDLAARDLAAVWHPCAQMADYVDFPPLEVVGAEGCRLHLADGRRIYDAISSWWCKALGHRHPRLLAALADQAARFEHVIIANTTSEALVRLCERLLAVAKCGQPHFGKVFLADNGSTAVEVALKMALQAQAQAGRTQRTRFACFENGYHGETAGCLSVGDCDLYRRHYGALTVPAGVLRGLPYRQGPQDPAWMDASPEWPAIERQLDALAPTLAAVVYEPVLQAAGGMRLYAPDLLTRLRAWADAHDVLLIADEIAAGWGRLGAMLASHLAPEALPDLAVLGKGLTAGVVPLAAVLATDRLYDLFWGDWASGRAFLHSNTFAGNALAVAVAHAVLDEFAQARICERSATVGRRLRDLLAEVAAACPGRLGPVRGCGMVAAVDLAGCDPAARTGYRVYREAVRRGALCRPLGDTLYLLPPLTTDVADLAAMARILGDSVEAVVQAPSRTK